MKLQALGLDHTAYISVLLILTYHFAIHRFCLLPVHLLQCNVRHGSETAKANAPERLLLLFLLFLPSNSFYLVSTPSEPQLQLPISFRQRAALELGGGGGGSGVQGDCSHF